MSSEDFLAQLDALGETVPAKLSQEPFLQNIPSAASPLIQEALLHLRVQPDGKLRVPPRKLSRPLVCL